MKMLVIAALMAPPAAVSASPLELVCRGEAIKASEQTSYGSFNAGGESASGEVTTYSKDRSSERLRIRIEENGSGSIKMPPGLVPPRHTGGKDGWWPLKSITMSNDRISASYQLNILNQGSLKIDRRTGDIDAKALAMRFSGTCEKAAEAPEERKF